MRPTKHSQDKLHDLLKAAGYTIRYEKGNFTGGYCVVLDQKVVLINKFHPIESKINSLVQIAREIEFAEVELSPDLAKLLQEIQKS
ncbi:MAG: hypothetical protein EAZ89_04870 [Bacteroidetes bacterium]|jgi:hypothetical protein|nr:MAG: hypothetical protein EAZ89_04870 [Bacteroidota bacterium]